MIFMPAAADTGSTQLRFAVAVDVHRARAAKRLAAAELAARHSQVIAQHPQQRRIRLGVGLLHSCH